MEVSNRLRITQLPDQALAHLSELQIFPAERQASKPCAFPPVISRSGSHLPCAVGPACDVLRCAWLSRVRGWGALRRAEETGREGEGLVGWRGSMFAFWILESGTWEGDGVAMEW